MPLHKGTGNIDGLPNYKQPVVVTKKALSISFSIAVLFYTTTELSSTRVEYSFYLGGIFKNPLKITSILRDTLAPPGYTLTNLYPVITILNNGKLLIEFLLQYGASRFDNPNDTLDIEHDFYILNNKIFVKTHFEELFSDEFETGYAPTPLSFFNSTNRCVQQFVRFSEVIGGQIILNTGSVYKNRIYIVQNIDLQNIKFQEKTKVDLQVLNINNSTESCEYSEVKIYKGISCFGLQSNPAENKQILAVIGWR